MDQNGTYLRLVEAQRINEERDAQAAEAEKLEEQEEQIYRQVSAASDRRPSRPSGDGKLEEEIPISGRIVIVADNFDALTHSRPYAEAWDSERAAAEIRRGAEQLFDPDVVEAFGSVDLEALLAPIDG